MTKTPDLRIDELEAEVRRLATDVDRLRARLDATEGDQRRVPPPPPPWVGPSTLPTPPPPSGQPAGAQQTRPHRPLVLESEIVLKWAGVALVVLAVGFALSTAIRRGWIGPELQLAGAILVSLAMIGTGFRLSSTRPLWTHALCSGGVAALFTTVASDLFLDQTGDTTAFVGTAVIGLGGYVVARLARSEWVAAVNLLGAVIGWLVIADGELPFVATLAWMVALVAIGLGLSLERGWFALRLVAHGIGLVAVAILAEDAASVLEQVLVLGAAAALLSGSLVRLPSIGDLTTAWQQLDVQLAAAAAPWAFGVIVVALDLDGDRLIGAVGIAVAIWFALVAVGIRAWIRPAHVVSILLGASVGLSIGLAFMLSTSAAYVALAVQGAGLVILARVLGDNVRVFINAAIVSAIAALYTSSHMVQAWTFDDSIGDDIAHLAIIAALAVAGWQSRHRVVQQATAAATLGLVLVWLGSVLVHLPQGQGIVSMSWAVIGVIVLVAGAIRRIPEIAAAGLAVLGLTVAKLLTVDLQEVDALWRAGLFFVVGMGIMRLGFLLPRLAGTPRAAVDAPDLETDGGDQAV